MIFPHSVMLYPSELVTDTDGNFVRRPVSTGVAAVGFVQPGQTSEDNDDGQSAEARYTLYLDPTAPRLDAFARLEWDGRSFETIGAAQRWANPDETVTYWRLALRTTGQ